MKKIYLVRHCKATGQLANATLTEEGFEQSQRLKEFFDRIEVKRIISSPYIRAKQSIEPLAKKLRLEIEMDERLSERVLTDHSIDDWMEKLAESFADRERKLPGGESSDEATIRILEVLNSINEEEITVLVSHGNLTALLLNHFDSKFGFEQWKQMSNPDVFLLNIEEGFAEIKKVW